MINILVTGAGALLGQGILRSIRMIEELDYYLISADPEAKSTGHFIADKSYLIPYASDPDYIYRIEQIILEENIDIVFIGTDVELPLFAENKEYLENKYNTKIVVSSTDVVEIANDKWKTSEFLRNNGFPYPISSLTTDDIGISNLIKLNKFPYIAKPIDGARSRGLIIVEDEKQLLSLCDLENNLVVQELLSDEEGEFTTGCLVINGECVSIVSLKRDLRDGNTWRAYRNGENPYDSIIKEIAEKLNPDGPLNFQYRIKNGQPVIFEINCRFSGTTPIRAIFGVNEVEALLRYYFEDKPITQGKIKNGTLLRTFSDIFIENEVVEELKSNKVLVNPKSSYYPFKR